MEPGATTVAAQPSPDRPRTLRLAHRGDWRAAPENSLAAMEAALRVPACDGLEFDVRASKDGVAILLHDPTLRRVQNIEASPADLTAEECAALGISSLGEVLRRVGRDPFLDVELKERVPAVIEQLERERAGPADGGLPGLHRAVLSSFDPEILAWLRGARPAWPRWLNAIDLHPPTISMAVALGCEAISADWRRIDEAGMARAAAAGLQVAAWTVRSVSDFDRLAALGVTAICVEAAALDG